MTTSNYITFILLGVIGLVFLIDFILNSRKKPLEKSVEKFVEKEKNEGKSSLKWLNWILDRKKNFTLSLLLISAIKFSVHYFFLRLCTYKSWFWNGYICLDCPRTPKKTIEFFHNKSEYMRIVNLVDSPLRNYGGPKGNRYGDLKCQDITEIANGLYIDRLELFIPIVIVFLVVVWFFNDKIKAR
jgi:hypothetical protein